jgi:3D (Asp-Asp-Asp) domain-containing protein
MHLQSGQPNFHQQLPMRAKIILNLVLILLICPFAKAEIQYASSKSQFSKSSVRPAADVTSDAPPSQGRLARVSAYWPGEDYYTNHKLSATGVRLRDGFCAVDSSIIPYGSLVQIPGVGNYIAMDTGTAVISRKAARESGHNPEERSALVIDLYFASRRAGELFSKFGPKFAMVAWQQPTTLASRD